MYEYDFYLKFCWVLLWMVQASQSKLSMSQGGVKVGCSVHSSIDILTWVTVKALTGTIKTHIENWEALKAWSIGEFPNKCKCCKESVFCAIFVQLFLNNYSNIFLNQICNYGVIVLVINNTPYLIKQSVFGSRYKNLTHITLFLNFATFWFWNWKFKSKDVSYLRIEVDAYWSISCH